MLRGICVCVKRFIYVCVLGGVLKEVGVRGFSDQVRAPQPKGIGERDSRN